MLIVCPACVSSYRVDLTALGHAGMVPRCAHCRQPLGFERVTAAPAIGPDALALDRSKAGQDGSALRGVVAVCLGLVAVSMALGWREPIARAVPGAATLYRIAGLQAIAPEPVVRDLKTVLTPDGLNVEGTLANPHQARIALSRLHLTIRDGTDGTLASWTVAPPKPSLGPGETVMFTSHLDKPPTQGQELAVSFPADRVAESDGQ